jgi:hypothetical protein
MVLKKYLGEFFYGVAAVSVLFSAATAALIVAFAPFGLMVYLGDVLKLHSAIAFGSVVISYAFYYSVARHFNLFGPEDY